MRYYLSPVNKTDRFEVTMSELDLAFHDVIQDDNGSWEHLREHVIVYEGTEATVVCTAYFPERKAAIMRHRINGNVKKLIESL